MYKISIPATVENLGDGLDFIEESLKDCRFNRKSIQDAMLLSEESMVRLIEQGEKNCEIQITIKYFLGLASIKLSAPGIPIESIYTSVTEFDAEDAEMNHADESTIRDILFHANEGKIKFGRKGKYNYVEVTAGVPKKVFAFRTFICFAAAMIIGSLMMLLPDVVQKTIVDYALFPIQTIFINALKLSTGPAVFFAIVANVARYASFSDPGRVSVKVFLGYAISSISSVLVGFFTFFLISPGTSGSLASFAEQAVALPEESAASFVNKIIDIVPSNIIDPFLNLDALQLIFMALICGIAVGRIGDYSASLKQFSQALETLFSKVAALLYSVVPIVVFFSTINLLFSIGYESMIYILEMLGTVCVGLVLMCIVYMFILVFSGVNPFTFLRKYAPTMWNTFLSGSEVTSLPKTILCCKNALGISPKVYSFSIPFGAIANMDGNCVYLTIAGLFLAKLCGVEIFSREIIPMIFSVVVLSIGAPITSGTVLLCMTVLVSQIGVSLNSLALLLGVNVILEMLLAVSNTIGDVVITLSVAKTEKLVDMDVFKAKLVKRKRVKSYK